MSETRAAPGQPGTVPDVSPDRLVLTEIPDRTIVVAGNNRTVIVLPNGGTG